VSIKELTTPLIPGQYFIKGHEESIEGLLTRVWGHVNGHRLIILIMHRHRDSHGLVYHRRDEYKLKIRGGRQKTLKIASAQQAQDEIPQLEANYRFASQEGDWVAVLVPKYAPESN